jgi:hypothetical protein
METSSTRDFDAGYDVTNLTTLMAADVHTDIKPTESETVILEQYSSDGTDTHWKQVWREFAFNIE